LKRQQTSGLSGKERSTIEMLPEREMAGVSQSINKDIPEFISDPAIPTKICYQLLFTQTNLPCGGT
jgi:hypothetical protein